ncbi:MAG: metal-sulfur cluster assembly factor [bacterium]
MFSRGEVENKLKEIYDPEIPVNIFDLGLIYGIDISDDGVVKIDMTLTARGCPIYNMLLSEIKKKVMEIEGVKGVEVNLVWEPAWTPERITEAGREALRRFGFF